MITPLRKKRLAKFETLEALQQALEEKGLKRTVAYLSRLERNHYWPTRKVVSALIDVFDGELTQDEILNPEKYQEKENHAA